MKALLCSLLLCPLAALAIESSTSIKVTPLLKTATSWDGQTIQYPAGTAEVSALNVEIAPGAETGWHLHPVPSFAYVLQGTLEVTLKDGRMKHLEAGEALAEVANVWHNGRNVGSTPVKLVVFYTSANGAAVTVKAPVNTAQ